jgi:hypothetical protein
MPEAYSAGSIVTLTRFRKRAAFQSPKPRVIRAAINITACAGGEYSRSGIEVSSREVVSSAWLAKGTAYDAGTMNIEDDRIIAES